MKYHWLHSLYIHDFCYDVQSFAVRAKYWLVFPSHRLYIEFLITGYILSRTMPASVDKTPQSVHTIPLEDTGRFGNSHLRYTVVYAIIILVITTTPIWLSFVYPSGASYIISCLVLLFDFIWICIGERPPHILNDLMMKIETSEDIMIPNIGYYTLKPIMILIFSPCSCECVE